MAFGIHQVLPPVQAIAGLPDLGCALRPGLTHQFKAMLQVEIDIGEVIRQTAGHVHLLGQGVEFQPVTVARTQALAQATVKLEAFIEIDRGNLHIAVIAGTQ